ATLGNPSDSSLGRYGEALELLEKPVAIAERLLARDELDREFALAAASTFRARGVLRGNRGKFEDARADFERSLGISRKALVGAPLAEEVALIRQICGALKDWIDVQRAERDFQGAQLLEEELRSELEAACARHPGDNSLKYLAGSAETTRGENAQSLGDFQRAVASFERALVSLEPLCVADPENNSYRRAVALTCEKLADSLCSVHDNERAAEFANRALVAWEDVVRRDPADDAAFTELANFANKVGYTENFRRRLEASRVGFERALEVQDEVVRRHPDQAGRRAGRGFIMAELASTLAELGRWREAVALGARGLDDVLAIEKDPTRGERWLYSAAMTSVLLAECRICVARDADWPAAERRTQIEQALQLLDAAHARLLASRDAGELLPQNEPEFDDLETRRKLANEVLASLPTQ
ncbi:MAG TPA: hypothetical protein VM509_14340, partial [Planctomycetota bacterium]|nr:hypothetical protein [Planctomycetota bacterium]